MIEISVPGWKVWDVVRAKELFATYPQGDAGYSLVFCKLCGQVYAASETTQIYFGPPIPDQIAGTVCVSCGELIGENWGYYPEEYLDAGVVYRWTRPRTSPSDKYLEFRSFPNLYGEIERRLEAAQPTK